MKELLEKLCEDWEKRIEKTTKEMKFLAYNDPSNSMSATRKCMATSILELNCCLTEIRNILNVAG